MNRSKQKKWAAVLAGCVVFATVSGALASQSDQPAAQSTVQNAQLTPAQLEQLVAPIALYPDALVAQIVAAATYPDEIAQADRWMQQHADLKGEALAQQVDQQSWDPAVKALTEFPSVLANMDKNLSWTSSLGDAYVNHQQDVMNAVQVMRGRAQKAGNLKTTSQEKVTQKGKTIAIDPAEADVIYVPQYDPWLVYGPPVGAWPGWYGYPGLFINGPGIGFGLGFGIGFFGGFGWGWHHWGSDWHHSRVVYDHNTYISHSRTFVNRGSFAGRGRVNGSHAGDSHGRTAGPGPAQHNQPGTHVGPGPAVHNQPGAHFGPGPAVHNQPGTHSSAFGGFQHGGMTRGFSSGGRSSFGGGFHGGGGGFHGGGGHGGGGRR
jgi:uncharacterized membrane protein YgcG